MPTFAEILARLSSQERLALSKNWQGPPIAQAGAAVQQNVRQEPPRPSAAEMFAEPLRRPLEAPGPWAPPPWAPEMAVGMLPGAGDVMSAMESQRAGQRMAEAWRSGDYGGAISGLLESMGHAAGAMPMIPAIGGMMKSLSRGRESRNVIDLPLPSWARTATEKSVEIIHNPNRADVGKLFRRHGKLRALRDPSSGELYVWGSDLGLHREAATHLDLPFRTRDDLQAHSFILHDIEDFENLLSAGELQ